PDAPIGEVEVRVIRAGNPYGAAADLPGISGPGLIAGLARTWNGIEAPGFFAGPHVVGSNKATDTELTTRYPYNHFIFHHERSMSEDIAGPGAGHSRVPHKMATPGV